MACFILIFVWPLSWVWKALTRDPVLSQFPAKKGLPVPAFSPWFSFPFGSFISFLDLDARIYLFSKREARVQTPLSSLWTPELCPSWSPPSSRSFQMMGKVRLRWSFSLEYFSPHSWPRQEDSKLKQNKIFSSLSGLLEFSDSEGKKF